jgi:aquaporin NIP
MRKCLAEFLGTFALVFCGTGVVVIDQQSNGAVTHVGVAITFGLTVMAMIYSLGDISGAHMNPAVTIAFTIAKRFQLKQVLPYINSQMSGAFLASLVLHYLFPANATLGATLPAGKELLLFILEFILTYFLMLVIINVATGSKEQEMFAGPVCGASMNPARSVSPALVSGYTENLWIYIVAPIAGAALAVPVFKILHFKNKQNANGTLQ